MVRKAGFATTRHVGVAAVARECHKRHLRQICSRTQVFGDAQAIHIARHATVAEYDVRPENGRLRQPVPSIERDFDAVTEVLEKLRQRHDSVPVIVNEQYAFR